MAGAHALGSLGAPVHRTAATRSGGTRILPLEECARRGQPLISEQEARDYCARQRWKPAAGDAPVGRTGLRPARPGPPARPLPPTRGRACAWHAFIRARGQRRWFAPSRRTHSYWQPGDGTEVWTLRPVDTILNRQQVEGPGGWQEALPI